MRLEIYSKTNEQSWNHLRNEINLQGTHKVDSLKAAKVYCFDGANLNLSEVEPLFIDPVEQYCLSQRDSLMNLNKKQWIVEVSYLPGVTDNEGAVADECLKLILDKKIKSYSSYLWFIEGDSLSRSDIEKMAKTYFGNPQIQGFKIYCQTDDSWNERFSRKDFPKVKLEKRKIFSEIDLDQNDDQLLQMNRDNCWALNLEEIKQISKYYKSLDENKREFLNLPQKPTDVEIEVLAQTWSEHCKHKIFNANIEYKEEVDLPPWQKKIGPLKVESLFKDFIKKATSEIIQDNNISWAKSLFTDNAGVIRFDDFIDICLKVETHNSPSALDPYGGALTGILGVNRDILGCGLGARPVANLDVFCLGHPDHQGELPIGLKHPKTILQGVHKGVQDGGNKSGIPTINGSIFFHENYSGKPLVFCGTLGVMPQKLKDGRDGFEKNVIPGDRIFMVGGDVGVDGIHGATFSSLELNENAPSTAVQIGDPLTQKRVLDFILEARDLGLFNTITDNGAGGLSSSVGEMAELCGGASIDLAKVPLKYPGLSPFEIMISESQERMTLAVSPKKSQEFIDLATRRGVRATDIGYFHDRGDLEIFFEQTCVGLLNLKFLHDGLPQMKLEAIHSKNIGYSSWQKKKTKPLLPEFLNKETLLKVLSSSNIRSKEDLVRQYDHEVGAATIGKPFVGQGEKGPADAGVIMLAPHGGAEKNALALGHGLAPRMSYYDSYLMGQLALDEAIRNVISVGANPHKIAILDNYCWSDPVYSEKNPEGKTKCASLVRATKAIYDLSKIYKTPFISGKDSMKNDFRGKMNNGEEVKISIPPTLLITSVAQIEDFEKTISSDFKNEGDLVYLFGNFSTGLLGAEIEEHYKTPEEWNHPVSFNGTRNLKNYNILNKFILSKKLKSVHDISEGGILISIVESMIGGSLGCRIEGKNLFHLQNSKIFSESSGCFIISLAPEHKEEFENNSLDFQYLGKVTKKKTLHLTGERSMQIDQSDLLNAWRRPW